MSHARLQRETLQGQVPPGAPVVEMVFRGTQRQGVGSEREAVSDLATVREKLGDGGRFDTDARLPERVWQQIGLKKKGE